ncbi:hypothetical protein Syun_022983 [Stephania yunnanensis]|uniref:Uncharacterized protein n=1 Tax=Stephania yunnanensis TaxID=152371 RepID=A0AAP0FAU2_9MAGN
MVSSTNGIVVVAIFVLAMQLQCYHTALAIRMTLEWDEQKLLSTIKQAKLSIPSPVINHEEGSGSSSTSNILRPESSVPSPGVGHEGGAGPTSISASTFLPSERSVPSPGVGHEGGPGSGFSSTSNIWPTERSVPSPGVGHEGELGLFSTSTIWQTEMSVPSPAIGHGGGPPLSKNSKTITAAAPEEPKTLIYNKKLDIEDFRPTSPGHSPGIANEDPPPLH